MSEWDHDPAGLSATGGRRGLPGGRASCWALEGRTRTVPSFPSLTVGLARAAAGKGVGVLGEPRVALFPLQPEVGIPGPSLTPPTAFSCIVVHAPVVCCNRFGSLSS